jgi:hypothetical protein
MTIPFVIDNQQHRLSDALGERRLAPGRGVSSRAGVRAAHGRPSTQRRSSGQQPGVEPRPPGHPADRAALEVRGPPPIYWPYARRARGDAVHHAAFASQAGQSWPSSFVGGPARGRRKAPGWVRRAKSLPTSTGFMRWDMLAGTCASGKRKKNDSKGSSTRKRSGSCNTKDAVSNSSLDKETRSWPSDHRLL